MFARVLCYTQVNLGHSRCWRRAKVSESEGSRVYYMMIELNIRARCRLADLGQSGDRETHIRGFPSATIMRGAFKSVCVCVCKHIWLIPTCVCVCCDVLLSWCVCDLCGIVAQCCRQQPDIYYTGSTRTLLRIIINSVNACVCVCGQHVVLRCCWYKCFYFIDL